MAGVGVGVGVGVVLKVVIGVTVVGASVKVLEVVTGIVMKTELPGEVAV